MAAGDALGHKPFSVDLLSQDHEIARFGPARQARMEVVGADRM
jgi:hypothetical protein